MADQALFDNFAAALRAREETTPAFLTSGEPVRTEAGLAVYRNNVRSSLSRALAETFPVVNQLVGEDFFKFTAREYFNAHPPVSPLIAHYGDYFPSFLKSFEPAKSVPYLADMAQFETLWLRSYRAIDAAPMPIDEIRSTGDGDPSNLTFALHPSFRLFSSPWPILSIWRKHQENAAGAEIENRDGEHMLIVRPRQDVIVHAISSGEHAAIHSLATGATVEIAFSRALEIDNSFDPQSSFQTIFNSEIVIAASAAPALGD